MGRIATLGRAFISVHADTDPFARELRQQMRRLSDDMKEDTDRAGRDLGERLGQQARRGLGDAVARRKLEVDTDVNVSATSVARTEATLRTVTRNREVNVRVNRRQLLTNLGLVSRLVGHFVLGMVRIFGDFFNFGRQIGLIFGEAFKNLSAAMGGAGAATVTLGAAMVQLAAAVVALSAVLVVLVGILGLALAILVPLVQTTQLFLTVIPGLATTALFAFGPLILIFTNLSDAIKATTKDADTFAEAIEDFGSQTRESLTSLRDLVQFFLGIRETMQEAFFRPINQAISDLNVNLGPTFRDGFIQVAEAAGRFAGSFISLFDHPQAIPFFSALFDLAELGFDEIGDAGLNLLAAFANLINTSLPNVEESIEGIANLINGWADSINEFADDPNFQQTIDKWKEGFEDIRELTSEIFRLFGNLIRGFEEDGIPVLEAITGAFENLNEFLESDRGEQFFDGLRIAAFITLTLISSIVIVLGTIITMLGVIEDLFSQDITVSIQELQETIGPILGIVTLILDNMFQIEGTTERITFLIGVLGGPLGFIVRQVDDWKQLTQDVLDGITDIRQRAEEIIQRFVDFLGRLLSIWGVTGNIRATVTNIRDRFSGALTHVRNLLSPLATARDIAGNIAGFAASFRNALSTALGFVRSIRDTAAQISFPSPGGFFGSIFGAEGGIFNRPTSMIIGEAGAEALIPLTRPSRAVDLLETSGLADLVRGGDGASSGEFTGNLFLDSGVFLGVVEGKINQSNRKLKRRSLAGAGSAR